MSDGYVNSRVVLFDKEGLYVRHWGKKGKGDGEFDLSHDVVVDPKGTVYVADRTNAQILGVLGSYGKVQGKFDFHAQYGGEQHGLYLCGDQELARAEVLAAIE